MGLTTNKRKARAGSLLLIACFLFFACSNPTGASNSAGEAVITVSLGGGASRSVGFFEDNIADWGDFVFDLKLTPVSGGNVISEPKYAASTATATVTPGVWHIALDINRSVGTTTTPYAHGFVQQTISAGTNNITIPMGRPGGPHTIIFNINGGTGDTPSSATGKTILPFNSDFSHPTDTFDGWSPNADGSGGTFAPGSSYTPDGITTTLYARWVPLSLNSLTLVSGIGGSAPLTPIDPYTFTIVIGGFINNTDAQNVVLVIDPVPGLSFSGHEALGSASSGTKTFSVEVSFNNTGTTAVSSHVNINMSGVTGYPSGYTYTGGNSSAGTTVINGLSTSDAIPVSVTNIRNFNLFLTDTNTRATRLTRHYQLTQDIPSTALRTDLTGINTWVAIGVDGFPFTGSFDGNNHTITGLTIDLPGVVDQGMFGRIARNGTDSTTGVVKDFGLLGGSVRGHNIVGYIVAYSDYGFVENCYATGDVIGNSFVGGIVGVNNRGTVQYCYITGDVTGENIVGGVVGSNTLFGIVQNCYTTGEVRSVSSSAAAVGGVVGGNNGTVQNCYAIGNITSNSTIGGVVGQNTGGGTVQNCYATGEIRGSYSFVGGIAGELGTVQNCVALNPTITRTAATGGTAFGRVIGNINWTTYINNHARDDMTFNGISVATTSDPNGIHGADLAVDGTVPLISVFSPANGWNTAVWNVPGGTFFPGDPLPTLLNMPGAPQNPILPP
ncbi:MAG: InlB B-repeat-containing protein [Treponema sp.]|nr:InlB B-repeat-containing protein [Treponema sp.]